MKHTVIVVGAGVGGLSAAHELVKRGFKVKVFERRRAVGGKALSSRVRSTLGGEKLTGDLPTEHGFRFFPGWYRHLLSTMAEIPIADRAASFPEINVASNLVKTEASRMVWSDRPPVPVPMHLPRNITQAKGFADFLLGMRSLGIANGEIGFFLSRIIAFLATPEEVRLNELQKVTWWEYVAAESKSQAYQDLITATTRTLIAANAKEASAYTLGRLAIRTLSDTLSGVDHVLNGPTSEAWLESWRAHLEEEGVEFAFGMELDSIAFDDKSRTIASIQVTPVVASLVRKLRRMLPTIAYEDAYDRHTDPRFLDDVRAVRHLAQEIEVLSDDQDLLVALQKLSLMINAATTPPGVPVAGVGGPVPARSSPPPAVLASKDGRLLAFKRKLDNFITPPALASSTRRVATDAAGVAGGAAKPKAQRRSPFARQPSYPSGKIDPTEFYTEVSEALWAFEEAHSEQTVTGQHFVFALPVEQMAFYVNRSSAMTTLDPTLANIVRLANHTDWMAGIQIYLSEKVDLGKGHFILMDSPWALTAIEQRQFWPPGKALSPRVKSLISVDIANWSVPGRFTRKKAQDCTDAEIAFEVWSELKTASNRADQKAILTDEMLLGGPSLNPRVNYCVDESIVELFDRKKQAAYEKARSVQLSVLDSDDLRASSTPFVSGPRLRFNAEPLLINRVNTWSLRPSAKTGIANMFLAADYVRTETDLACMEGANEAARRAVNALLDVVGSTAERCKIWEFSVPQNLSAQLLGLARLGDIPSLSAAATGFGKVADSATDMAARATGMFRGFFKKG